MAPQAKATSKAKVEHTDSSQPKPSEVAGQSRPCSVEVLDRFERAGVIRGRWKALQPVQLETVGQAEALARELMARHGGARVTAEGWFEVTALRHYFAVKLLGTEAQRIRDALPSFETTIGEPQWADPLESALASHEGRT